MKRWRQTLAMTGLVGVLTFSVGASETWAGWGWRRAAAGPVVVTQRVIVPAPTTAFYAPAPVTAYYAPAPVARAAYYSPAYAAPVTAYYGAPAGYVAPAPVTTYYGPRRVRTYYAPGVFYVP